MTREAYEQVFYAPHKAKLSHELIAAAASYEAMKLWNEHKEKNGETVDHAKMKQFLAAAAGAFVDRMIETKGLDAIDHHRVKQQAEERFGDYQGHFGDHHHHHEHGRHHHNHHRF